MHVPTGPVLPLAEVGKERKKVEKKKGGPRPVSEEVLQRLTQSPGKGFEVEAVHIEGLRVYGTRL